MKQPEPSSIVRKFEKLTNIFYLMVGVPLLVFAWTYLNLKLLRPWSYFEEPLIGPFLHALILIAAVTLPILSYRKYKSQIASSGLSGDGSAGLARIKEKTDVFIAASLQFYYALTFSTVLVVIGFYFSAEEFYIFFYSILLILYSINRPTPQRMIKEMRLNKEDKEALFQALKNPEL